MNAVERALRPVRRRVRAVRAARAGGWALCLAAAGTLGVRAASFLTPIEQPMRFTAPVLALAALIVLIAALWPVPKRLAASASDAGGLMQRALTALELSGNASPMAELQREDAVKALNGLNVRRAMPLSVRKAAPIAAGVCAVLWIALGFVPNPQGAAIAQNAALHEILKKQADQIEKAADALPKDENDAQLAELQKLAKELAKSLRESQTSRDALLSMNEADDKIRKIEKQQVSQAVNDATSALNAGGLDALKNALEQGNASAIKQAAQDLAGGNASSAKSALSAAAAAAPSGSALQAAFQAAAQAAPGAASNAALNQLAQKLASTASTSTASTFTGLIASARAGLGGQPASGSQSASGGKGTLSGKGKGGSGNGGQGQTGSGSGAGSGSTNRDSGYADSTGKRSASGTGAPVYKTGAYESIYDPTRLGDGGDISQAAGKVGEGETAQADLAPGLGQAGGTVPFAQGAHEYGKAAANAADQPGVSDAVKNMVNRYFNALIDESEGSN